MEMNLNDLTGMTRTPDSTEPMPVLFLGHGSPMNAIGENEFTLEWEALGRSIPSPRAVLCISAHWETRGTMVTAMEKPSTIHDFGGFPQELFNVEYPAPGSPELAALTCDAITSAQAGLDYRWGLDHGCWSVLKHMYPEADVPVIQLSLDYGNGPQYHYDLARELAPLRRKGILVIGSGNIVHNLGRIAWDKMDKPGFGFDWALEASDTIRKLILTGDHQSLIHYRSLGKAVGLAIPTPDHYLPLLYVLALKEENEAVTLFNDKPLMGSLTMTSLKITRP